MDKDFFKGLLFFAAGFVVARYLMKKTLVVDNTPFCGTGTHLDTATGKCVADAAGQPNVVANVNGILDNVATWLQTNFSDNNLTDEEAHTYAQQATGITPETTGATGDANIAVYQDIHTDPLDNSQMGQQLPVISTYAPLGYQQNPNFMGGIIENSPDMNDMRMATGSGGRNKMGKLESNFTWSFN